MSIEIPYGYEIIKPDGERCPFKTIEKLPLGAMQAIVGGYIEALPTWFTQNLILEEHRAYVNEDGKFNRFIMSDEVVCNSGDAVVGNVLIEYGPFDDEDQ